MSTEKIINTEILSKVILQEHFIRDFGYGRFEPQQWGHSIHQHVI
jgi:hypothetical protein